MNLSAFDAALLSQASYAYLHEHTKPESDLTLVKVLTDKKYQGTFSQSQAEEFAERWEVVYHQPDMASGFSGTLFKSKDPNATQPYAIALRGTEELDKDLVEADIKGIALKGLAIAQIVDMYNFIGRITTKKGELFTGKSLVNNEDYTTKLKTVVGLMKPLQTLSKWAINNIISNDPNVEIMGVMPQPGATNYTGVLDDPLPVDLSNLIGVAGHSLGGHLAVALTRLVDGVQATTINGAGYSTGAWGKVNNGSDNIPYVFKELGGADHFKPDNILNFYGDKKPEIVTMNETWGLEQQGGHQELFIEDAGLLENTWGHGKEQMVDGLAVADLLTLLDKDLILIDGKLNYDLINKLFKAAENKEKNTYERVVNTLGDFLNVGEEVVEGDRQAFYERIWLIQNKLLENPRSLDNRQLKAEYQGLQVQVLTTDLDSISRIARQDDETGLAYRYALQHLNPFAIVGADYSAHNVNHQLDLYNSNDELSSGSITQEWIKDRSNMLKFKNIFGNKNIDYSERLNIAWGLFPTPVKGDYIYQDIDSGIKLDIDGVNPFDFSEHYIIFGGAGNDTLQGGKLTKQQFFCNFAFLRFNPP